MEDAGRDETGSMPPSPMTPMAPRDQKNASDSEDTIESPDSPTESTDHDIQGEVQSPGEPLFEYDDGDGVEQAQYPANGLPSALPEETEESDRDDERIHSPDSVYEQITPPEISDISPTPSAANSPVTPLSMKGSKSRTRQRVPTPRTRLESWVRILSLCALFFLTYLKPS